MQFHKTWNTSFDQIFKAESLLEKNNQIFERPSTYQSTRKQTNRKSGTSRAYEIDQLIRMLTEKTYHAKSQILSLSVLENLPDICLKKYRESIYYGQFVNSCREGLGLMLYTNGRIYEGFWQNNYKHGKGYEKHDNGAQYEGSYKEGKPSGYGRFSWQNGETYQGEWLDGMKNGSGIWRGPAGDSYIGQWKDGQANGYGVHTWVNGDRYEGQFINCLKHGQGIQKFSNGDSYKGMYQNGRPEGYGEYYWGIGSFFKGNFKNGLRDGDGVWKSGPGNSDRYQGEYKEDKKDGYGVFIWSNGNIYKGNFKNDLRQGYGQMLWNDGRCYKGNWQEGMQLDGQQQMENFQEQTPDRQYFDEDPEIQNQVPRGINPNINKGIQVYENPQQLYQTNNRWQPSNISAQRDLFSSKRMKFNNINFNQLSKYNEFNYEGGGEHQNGWMQAQGYNDEKVNERKNKIKNSPYLLNNTRDHHYNIHNPPNCPTVYISTDPKKFRFRGSSKKSQGNISQKSSKIQRSEKQFTRNNPDNKMYFENNFYEGHNSKKIINRNKLNQTDGFQNRSVRLRNNASSESYKKKLRNQNVSSSQSNRNASEKMMMSSTFFLYKIHGNNPNNQGNHIRNRVVKTSGGTRSKRQVENAQYYQQHILKKQY